MRIVFDGQAFQLENRGGISRYVVWLAAALQKLHVDVRVVAPVHHNAHLHEASGIPRSGRYFERPLLNRRVDALMNRLLEPAALYMARPDILHATYYTGRSTGGAKARVLTVHDMIHERFTHWHPHDPIMAMKARAVAQADHVICISRATQLDLCELLQVPEHKTSVICHGANRLPQPSLEALSRVPAEPFVLFVGQRHRHKNFGVLLRAFGASPLGQSGLRLIAFGGKPFNADELEEARRCGLDGSRLARVTGDDDLLAAYYSRAVVLVYPSLYEGFGAPLLEAMALGCPVITCNASCMPEIAGDAALYFQPGDPEELAVTIERLYSSSGLRHDIVAAGHRREAQFTWEKCASETLSVYTKVLQQGH